MTIDRTKGVKEGGRLTVTYIKDNCLFPSDGNFDKLEMKSEKEWSCF